MTGYSTTSNADHNLWYLFGTILLTIAMALISWLAFSGGDAPTGIGFTASAAVGVIFIVDAALGLRARQ